MVYIYLHVGLNLRLNVGKYTIPNDPMRYQNHPKPITFVALHVVIFPGCTLPETNSNSPRP